MRSRYLLFRGLIRTAHPFKNLIRARVQLEPVSSVVLAGDDTGSSCVNCGSVESRPCPLCPVLFFLRFPECRHVPLQVRCLLWRKPEWRRRITLGIRARDGLIGDSRLNPFPPNRTFPCWKRLKVSHNTGTWLYASDVSRVWVFCGVRRRRSAASDSERRRWYAGCPNLFLELSRCAPVTGAGQTAHDFNFPIHYRRSQNRDGINRVLDRLISIWILVISCNVE